VITVRTADGETYDAVQFSPYVNDAKGTVRVDLPASVSKSGATFVVDGLTDPWGRPFPGQPVEIPLEP